jgi:CHAT domain-containing protein
MSPIMTELGYDSAPPKGISKPRVWWCPTGPLVFLPIHAAGPYRRGSGVDVGRSVISSYTTTLRALVRARSRNLHSRPSDNPVRMLAISQPDSPNQLKLASVQLKTSLIQESVSSGTSFRLLDGAEATVEDVLHHLEESSWVHFACHGIQDQSSPMESRLILHDGNLRLSTIASTLLPLADFAFLSVCHSAGGAEGLPDEAMHLAAGFQFSGFRSVIATMWAMGDSNGPIVAEYVYKHIFRDREGGTPDSKDAAAALDKGVGHLREMGVPFAQWVAFVHIGI